MKAAYLKLLFLAILLISHHSLAAETTKKYKDSETEIEFEVPAKFQLEKSDAWIIPLEELKGDETGIYWYVFNRTPILEKTVQEAAISFVTSEFSADSPEGSVWTEANEFDKITTNTNASIFMYKLTLKGNGNAEKYNGMPTGSFLYIELKPTDLKKFRYFALFSPQVGALKEIAKTIKVPKEVVPVTTKIFQTAKSNLKWSSFKNISHNYEIQIPDCYEREFARDDKITSAEQSNYVVYTDKKRCGYPEETGFMPSFSIASLPYTKTNSREAILEKIKNQSKAGLKKTNLEKLNAGSLNGNPISVGEERWVPKIYWSATIACKNEYHAVKIQIQADPLDLPQIDEEEIIFPAVEKKVLESFKCLDEKPK